MRKWLAGLALVLFWSQAATAGTILLIGDSISAGFGLDTNQGWAALLEQRLREQEQNYDVLNASISGDTTQGGLGRLPALLEQHRPQVVVIELGGNDGLRGQPLGVIEQNLEQMVTLAQAANAKVLVLGMQLPPNYGERYTSGFAQLFKTVSTRRQVALVPFFLEGVGGVEGMMQADGIHPALDAQQRLLDNAWPALKKLL